MPLHPPSPTSVPPSSPSRPTGADSCVAVIENVWKRYFILSRQTPRLGFWVFSKMVEHLRRTPFYALRDASLEVQRGRILGIIGANGAGKSTLLKVLAGITQPTRGRVSVRGRVASLLELGVGFHPDLTGMENIFYHAAIHGQSREQVLAKLQAIIEFSGLRDYLYEPVKHYSSGMYARLGCSVALHLEPDIALVDEVLSVGDAEFRDRVHGRLRQMIDAGVTVFLVTHEIGTAADLCDELIWMDGGRIKTRGRPSEVVLAYGRDTARRKLPPDHLLARAIGELQAKMGEAVAAGKGDDPLAEETRIDGAFAGPSAARSAASSPADSSFEIESARFLDERGDPIEAVATGGTVRLETRVRALRAVDAAALRVTVWHYNGIPLSHHLSPTRAFERDDTHCWRLRWSPTLWMCSEVFITVGVVDPRRPDVALHASPLTLTLGVIPPDMPQISMPHMVPARWRTP